jgi:DNA polymerase-3 subunit epsilon
LLRQLKPAENRQLRDAEAVFGLRYDPTRKRGPVLLRESLNGADPLAGPALYGAFRSKKEADAALREFASLYRLCPRRLGTEPWSDGPCLAHSAKRCAGVCAGKESPAEHDERLLKVLESLRLKRWPWGGPVIRSAKRTPRPAAWPSTCWMLVCAGDRGRRICPGRAHRRAASPGL